MRLQPLDAFAKKTADGDRVRTASGGLLSIAAAVIIVWLLILEVKQYLSVGWDSKLIIDSSRGELMDVVIDISFWDLPCELISLDQMDDAGDVQDHLDIHLTKQDLGADGQPLDPSVREKQQAEKQAAIAARGEDYAGPCYGAGGQNAVCRTCDDVRRAYAAQNWQFHDGHGFEQCVQEHYPEHLAQNKDNGCRVSGHVGVSKVLGKLHFAPGESYFSNQGQHSHDLSAYNLPEMPYTFSHTINRFSFGMGGSSQLEDPLQGYKATTEQKQFVFRYFTKVVGTEFVYRDGKVLKTNQYAVTHHERSLQGGRDEDHPHTHHSVGGIPGMWIAYDISPMKVVNSEKRGQTFGQLLMNIFAIIGAVITTSALVDRGVYEVDRALKARKDR